ncbi:DUF2256 domain-containing protein [Porticoccus sp.]|uniref:DUF2256 domain-containing protein n=1 Tax=Porticoccus sp. TaxID=2024853 RepID=UPI000C676331|nr:DUF2256 domain-containing protein [Porticoccus sp.]MAZ69749.1 DUF2256 domain-containing protein [Porticoccus sp.]
MPEKADLPGKICVVCRRPFHWRKKWWRVWQDVKYCSERCRRSRGKSIREKTIEQ